jgi:hypothetical protein
MLRVPFILPSWIFKKNLITLNLLVLRQRLLFFVPAKSQENSNKFIPQQISCNDDTTVIYATKITLLLLQVGSLHTRV